MKPHTELSHVGCCITGDYVFSEIVSSFSVYIILTVYTLVNIGQANSATLLSRSPSSYNEKIYLHLESNHFCLITDVKNYTNSYKCIYCSLHIIMRWRSIYWDAQIKPNLYIHGENIKCCFGVNVSQHMQYLHYFAVYDCETCQKNLISPWYTYHELSLG